MESYSSNKSQDFVKDILKEYFNVIFLTHHITYFLYVVRYNVNNLITFYNESFTFHNNELNQLIIKSYRYILFKSYLIYIPILSLSKHSLV